MRDATVRNAIRERRHTSLAFLSPFNPSVLVAIQRTILPLSLATVLACAHIILGPVSSGRDKDAVATCAANDK